MFFNFSHVIVLLECVRSLWFRVSLPKINLWPRKTYDSTGGGEELFHVLIRLAQEAKASSSGTMIWVLQYVNGEREPNQSPFLGDLFLMNGWSALHVLLEMVKWKSHSGLRVLRRLSHHLTIMRQTWPPNIKLYLKKLAKLAGYPLNYGFHFSREKSKYL